MAWMQWGALVSISLGQWLCMVSMQWGVIECTSNICLSFGYVGWGFPLQRGLAPPSNHGRVSGECFHTRRGCRGAMQPITLMEAILERMIICKFCREDFLKGHTAIEIVMEDAVPCAE